MTNLELFNAERAKHSECWAAAGKQSEQTLKSASYATLTQEWRALHGEIDVRGLRHEWKKVVL